MLSINEPLVSSGLKLCSWDSDEINSVSSVRSLTQASRAVKPSLQLPCSCYIGASTSAPCALNPADGMLWIDLLYNTLCVDSGMTDELQIQIGGAPCQHNTCEPIVEGIELDLHFLKGNIVLTRS